MSVWSASVVNLINVNECRAMKKPLTLISFKGCPEKITRSTELCKQKPHSLISLYNLGHPQCQFSVILLVAHSTPAYGSDCTVLCHRIINHPTNHQSAADV